MTYTLIEVLFTYDALDNRLTKTVDPDGEGEDPAETTTFACADGQVALEFSGTGGGRTLAQRYLYGPGVDQVLARDDGSEGVLWALADNEGTVRDLVNASGEAVEHLTYDSFGGMTGPATDFRFTYTGRELDAETGLYYYRARYYDSGTGRFLSEDPSGFCAGDANLYRYVSNNPLVLTDPTGLRPNAIVLPNGNSINHPELAAFLAGFGGSERAELLPQVQAAAQNPFTALGSELSWQGSAQRLIDELIADGQRGPAQALREAGGPAAGFSPASSSWSQITSWAADRAQHVPMPGGANPCEALDALREESNRFVHYGKEMPWWQAAPKAGWDTAVEKLWSMVPFLGAERQANIARDSRFVEKFDGPWFGGAYEYTPSSTECDLRESQALAELAVALAGARFATPNVPSTVTVFRVEGPANARVIIGEGGQVAIQGEKTLFLNFGSKAGALSAVK